MRDRVHELLHLPMADIRVVPTEVGGAFGGKNVGYADIVAALLARKANRPVRVVMSREETLLATGPTSGTWMRVAVGARRDGRITAAKAELRFEAGAFPGAPVGSGANCMFAPYDIPNGRIDGYGVVVNKPSTGDYRSPGATQAVFAAEAVLDEVATLLGMDPIAFRLLNCAHDGTARITGGVHEHIGIEQVLEATRDSAHYRAPCPESTGHLRRGRGVALGFWGNWGARSSVTLTVAEDGTVSLLTGSVDITGTRTSLAMQAAETLGLPLEMIAPAMGDTHSTGYSDNSGGSRTTMATGIAVVRAAEDLLARMKERVAAWWGVDASTVTYALGAFTSTTTGDTMSWAEAASHQFETGGAVRGQGDVNVRKWGAAYATHIVDVEVDTETGGVRLLRHTVVQDVGRAIHPGQVASQMQGGTSQGIGWALYEGYAYDAQGRMLNANLLDYKMPTYRDVPTIETILVEVPYPGHPYGIRGVGEAPIVAVPAAIAAAIHDAVGVRPTRLPMDPVQIQRTAGHHRSMSRVLVPPLMRDLTGGLGSSTWRDRPSVGDRHLERRFGFRRPTLSMAPSSRGGRSSSMAPSPLWGYGRVAADSEVRFAPAWQAGKRCIGRSGRAAPDGWKEVVWTQSTKGLSRHASMVRCGADYGRRGGGLDARSPRSQATRPSERCARGHRRRWRRTAANAKAREILESHRASSCATPSSGDRALEGAHRHGAGPRHVL